MAAIILAIATGVSTTPLTALASRFGGGEEGFVDPNTFRKAPAVISGENIYIAWWTNRSGNWEVMFRASNDGGAAFGDKSI